MGAVTNWYETLKARAAGGDTASAGYLSTINSSAAANGQSPQVLAQYIGDESSFDPSSAPIYANSHPVGLGQVQPGTASDPGYGIAPLADRTDPTTSIQFTSNYLAATQGRGYATTAQVNNEIPGAAGQLGSYSVASNASTGGTSTSDVGTPTGFTGPDGLPLYSGGGPASALTSVANAGSSLGGAAGKALGANTNGGGGGISATGSAGGEIQEYFVRGFLAIVAVVMIGVGLSMFKNGGALPSIPKVVPVPV